MLVLVHHTFLLCHRLAQSRARTLRRPIRTGKGGCQDPPRWLCCQASSAVAAARSCSCASDATSQVFAALHDPSKGRFCALWSIHLQQGPQPIPAAVPVKVLPIMTPLSSVSQETSLTAPCLAWCKACRLTETLMKEAYWAKLDRGCSWNGFKGGGPDYGLAKMQTASPGTTWGKEKLCELSRTSIAGTNGAPGRDCY